MSADQAVGLTDKETEMSIDQRLNTEKITPELINYIVEKLVREIQPEKIILFGSYARGDFDMDSDLDLFIIKDAKESSRIMRRKIDALLRGRRFAVDLLVRKPKEVEWNFRAKNPFYLYHIFRDGKVLYEKE
jgi:predicted nucleotidyltransferase